MNGKFKALTAIDEENDIFHMRFKLVEKLVPIEYVKTHKT